MYFRLGKLKTFAAAACLGVVLECQPLCGLVLPNETSSDSRIHLVADGYRY